MNMRCAICQKPLLIGGLVAALVATGCATRRQLADVQPGMTMAEVKSRFGPPDSTFAYPSAPGKPDEVAWYYTAFRPVEIFQWQTVPTPRPPGWRLEPGRTTVGVRYRRFELIFHDGVLVGRAEYEPPSSW